MQLLQSLLVAFLSLSATAFAAPIDAATTPSPTDLLDGCDSAYRGDHRACESAREQKHDGSREEHRGEREIQNGNIGKGIGDILKGSADHAAGKGRECYNGGGRGC
jgi:hypothetical protein